jgi:hypothetical protein
MGFDLLDHVPLDMLGNQKVRKVVTKLRDLTKDKKVAWENPAIANHLKDIKCALIDETLGPRQERWVEKRRALEEFLKKEKLNKQNSAMKVYLEFYDTFKDTLGLRHALVLAAVDQSWCFKPQNRSSYLAVLCQILILQFDPPASNKRRRLDDEEHSAASIDDGTGTTTNTDTGFSTSDSHVVSQNAGAAWLHKNGSVHISAAKTKLSPESEDPSPSGLPNPGPATAGVGASVQHDGTTSLPDQCFADETMNQTQATLYDSTDQRTGTAQPQREQVDGSKTYLFDCQRDQSQWELVLDVACSDGLALSGPNQPSGVDTDGRQYYDLLELYLHKDAVMEHWIQLIQQWLVSTRQFVITVSAVRLLPPPPPCKCTTCSWKIRVEAFI